MPSHIALRGLPIENLKRKPFRTGALLAVVTILALTFFGGTMLTMNPVSYTHLTLPTICSV